MGKYRHWGHYLLSRFMLTEFCFALMFPFKPNLKLWFCPRPKLNQNISYFLFAGTGGDPKTDPDTADVSYKVIDSQSPPYFLNTSRSLVYTTLGRTVILVCRVRNLGNRAVSIKLVFK